VRGISRHVVRFVAYGGDMYALKEMPDHVALREHRLLVRPPTTKTGTRLTGIRSNGRCVVCRCVS